MPKTKVETLVNRSLYAAAGMILFGLPTSLLVPSPKPELKGGFDNGLLALEMTAPAEFQVFARSDQETLLRWSLALDFGLIGSYVALFYFSAAMESHRVSLKPHSKPWWFQLPYWPASVLARWAIVGAGIADICQNLGLWFPNWFPFLLPWSTLAKWGLLGVALIAVSLLFVTWPLWSEFHVALAAAVFFYAVAGVIGIYGSLWDHHKLEQVALPLVLGMLTQTGIMIWRRHCFVAHVEKFRADRQPQLQVEK